MSVAGPVGVIDLDHPVLAAQRDDQVTIRGRPGDRVRVQPVNHVARDVGRIRGESAGAKIVEGIPVPYNLPVLVEDDDLIAEVRGGGAVEGNDFRIGGDDGRVTVGQELNVVVQILDRAIPHRGQLSVDGIEVCVAQFVPGQVDLPHVRCGPGAVRCTPQQENRSAWQNGRAVSTEVVNERIIVPVDLAGQVGR